MERQSAHPDLMTDNIELIRQTLERERRALKQAEALADTARANIGDLEAKLDHLTSTSKDEMRLLPPHPIRRLPPEMLQLIFEWWLAVHPVCVSSPTNPALTAAIVCKSWRRVALDCPRLWSNFTAAHSRHEECMRDWQDTIPRLARMWVERSKGATMTILLFIGRHFNEHVSPLASILVDILMSTMTRCERLYLDDNKLLPLVTEHAAPLANLRELRLHMAGNSLSLAKTLRILSQFPRLEDLDVMIYDRDAQMPRRGKTPIPIRLPHLRSLTVHCGWLDLAEHITGLANHLRTLVWTDCVQMAAFQFIGTLTRLENLSLKGECESQQCLLDEQSLIHALGNLTQLRTLEISNHDVTELFVQTMGAPLTPTGTPPSADHKLSDSQLWLLPRLTHLTLAGFEAPIPRADILSFISARKHCGCHTDSPSTTLDAKRASPPSLPSTSSSCSPPPAAATSACCAAPTTSSSKPIDCARVSSSLVTPACARLVEVTIDTSCIRKPDSVAGSDSDESSEDEENCPVEELKFLAPWKGLQDEINAMLSG